MAEKVWGEGDVQGQVELRLMLAAATRIPSQLGFLPNDVTSSSAFSVHARDIVISSTISESHLITLRSHR